MSRRGYQTRKVQARVDRIKRRKRQRGHAVGGGLDRVQRLIEQTARERRERERDDEEGSDARAED